VQVGEFFDPPCCAVQARRQAETAVVLGEGFVLVPGNFSLVSLYHMGVKEEIEKVEGEGGERWEE
jgi:hypothetical protein